MHRQLPESDWKAWRKLSQFALERFCARILDKAATFAKGNESAHDRYVRLFRYLQSRDTDIAAIFNDQRRSNAYQQIATAVSKGVVSRGDLEVFSEQTRAIVLLFLGER
jgi:hypothetical protein